MLIRPMRAPPNTKEKKLKQKPIAKQIRHKSAAVKFVIDFSFPPARALVSHPYAACGRYRAWSIPGARHRASVPPARECPEWRRAAANTDAYLFRAPL